MLDERPLMQPSDVLLSLAIGTEALAAVVPPWCGLGWSPWVLYLAFPTAALALAMRFRWSR